MKLAGAPISWGVSEAPGWGHQMGPERVLFEMTEIGLGATELGPPGFLPDDPDQLSRYLAAFDLRLVGGFVAAVLDDPAHRDEALRAVASAAAQLSSHGGVLVVAAATGAGYDRRASLDSAGWTALAESLDRVEEIAAHHGLTAAVHPHAGTMVERADDVRRLLERTGIGICLDTGHLLIGGADPVEVARAAGARVVHVHLKDVDEGLAARVQRGDLTYSEGVRQGLYRPLGAGDVDIAGLLRALRSSDYGGWFVLEQDVMLSAEPAPGSGPAADVRRSAEYFERLARASRAEDVTHGNEPDAT